MLTSIVVIFQCSNNQFRSLVPLANRPTKLSPFYLLSSMEMDLNGVPRKHDILLNGKEPASDSLTWILRSRLVNYVHRNITKKLSWLVWKGIKYFATALLREIRVNFAFDTDDRTLVVNDVIGV